MIVRSLSDYWKLAAAKVSMKRLAVAIGFIAAFWVGYGLCAYRAYGVTYAQVARSNLVFNASLLMRSVELIDRGETGPLRAKLLGVAKVYASNPSPTSQYTWKSFLLGPFEDTSNLAATTPRQTEDNAAAIRAKLDHICQAAPATDSYRLICGR